MSIVKNKQRSGTKPSFLTNVKYVTFQNEVPKVARAMSKECKPFDLAIPVSRNWDSGKNRVLFICEHVDTEDLRNGRLLSGQSAVVLNNVFKYAEKLCADIGEKPMKFEFAAINFNFFKTYHLSESNQKKLKPNAISARRVEAAIKRLRPTHVFISGCEAAHELLKDQVTADIYKMGWIHEVKIAGVKVKATNSYDYIKSLMTKSKLKKAGDDDDEGDDDDKEMAGAYLLGYFSRNLRNFLIGKNPYQIDIKPKGIMIDTRKKFDALMRKLEKAKVIAIDTETQNLNAVRNKIYILQFATSKNKGYILPYLHPETPFGPKDLQYIKDKLRAFFRKKNELILEPGKDKLALMFNGKFDLKVMKSQFGIPVFHLPVFDVRAAEFLLDENLKFMRDVAKVGVTKLNHGNLAQLACNYGVDFYYTAKFSKSERGDMDNTKLSDPAFIDYCAMDAQLLIAMYEKEMERARNEKYVYKGKTYNYEREFYKMCLGQMNNNIQMFGTMEGRGTNVDKKYLLYLKERNSPINQAIYKAKEEINNSKNARKANKRLLEDANVPTSNTLTGKTPNVFNIDKPAHKQMLFIDVMGLEPVKYGKNGLPSLGKLFKKKYEDVEEVKLLNDLEKVKKLKSSYVNAFVKFLSRGDGAYDGRLRPMFDFFDVVTGRSNSSKPSLQQIPQRSANAKHIKRLFAASRGHIIIKYDYSAHEIRVWSIISGDKVLAGIFEVGRRLRQKLFRTGKKKYANEIKLKGDVHKLNVEFFFKVPVSEVTDKQRDEIKGVGFGAIYGKAAATLAKELGTAQDYMEKLFKRFFARFKKASEWLEWAKSFSESYYFVKSAIGRRRYLFGYMTEVNRISSAMKRRAMNSPIQGIAADMGHTAGRLFQIELEKVLMKLKRMDESTELLPTDVEVMVHDSTRAEALFKNALICVHLMQWCATEGVVRYYNKYFDLKFPVYPEVELEFGVSEDKMYTWNWALTGDVQEEDVKDKEGNVIKKKDKNFPLDYCLRKTAEDYCNLYPDEKRKPKQILKEIYADWDNSKIKAYLDKKYPILPDARNQE